MALSGSERNAVQRALARGGRLPWCGCSSGLVPGGEHNSRPGTHHTVSVDDVGRYPLRLRGRGRWAGVLARARRIRRQGGAHQRGRVTGLGRRPAGLVRGDAGVAFPRVA